MAKTRKEIPKGTREKVLKEYSNSCAICGISETRLHLHHIDTDPSNNDLLNLIPLCPNHHDEQHNPVKAIETKRLRLFRIYKKLYILKPQFQPLFARLQFLDDVDENLMADELAQKTEELMELVEAHEMGAFYAKRLAELIRRPKYITVVDLNESEHRRVQRLQRKAQEYREQLSAVREKVYELVVEMLSYQRWETIPPDVSVHR